jgi:hypothetical protein
MVLYLRMRFVRAISVHSESSTYTLKSDGSGSFRCVAKVWCATHQRRPRARPAKGGLAPPLRNRFGGLPYDIARQGFAVVNFAVLGPEALDRVNARVGTRRCSAPKLLRNVGTRPSFAS